MSVSLGGSAFRVPVVSSEGDSASSHYFTGCGAQQSGFLAGEAASEPPEQAALRPTQWPPRSSEEPIEVITISEPPPRPIVPQLALPPAQPADPPRHQNETNFAAPQRSILSLWLDILCCRP